MEGGGRRRRPMERTLRLRAEQGGRPGQLQTARAPAATRWRRACFPRDSDPLWGAGSYPRGGHHRTTTPPQDEERLPPSLCRESRQQGVRSSADLCAGGAYRHETAASPTNINPQLAGLRRTKVLAPANQATQRRQFDLRQAVRGGGVWRLFWSTNADHALAGGRPSERSWM